MIAWRETKGFGILCLGGLSSDPLEMKRGSQLEKMSTTWTRNARNVTTYEKEWTRWLLSLSPSLSGPRR